MSVLVLRMCLWVSHKRAGVTNVVVGEIRVLPMYLWVSEECVGVTDATLGELQGCYECACG